MPFDEPIDTPDDEVSNAIPDWMADGLGISGEQTDQDLGIDTQWDTNAWSDDNQKDDFTSAGGGDCLSTAGDPPGSGTWILGSIDGVCQWIDTTTC